MRTIFLISTLLFAFLLASCSHDEIYNSGNNTPDIPEADTHVSFKTAIGLSNGETLLVNTIRVIMFTANGSYITHGLHRFPNGGRLFTGSNNNEIVIDSSGSDIDFVIPTVSGMSEVFVILNEEVLRSNGTSLTSALSSIKDLQSPRDALLALLAEPLPYDELIREEPSFVMFTTRNDFDVPPNRQYDNPYLLDFTGMPLVRPMARVTITGVSSELIDNLSPPRSDAQWIEASRIFILEMGLKNVPNRYSWTNPSWIPNVNTDFHPTLYFNRQDEIFHQDNPADNIRYYSRSWNGNMTITVTENGRVRQTQRLRDGRIWLTESSAGSTSYSANRSDLDVNLTNKWSANTGGRSPLQPHTWDNNVVQLNSGNFALFFAEFQRQFNDLGFNDDNFFPPTFEFLDTDQKYVTNVDPGDWWLNAPEMSFYIPENRLASNATTLYIRAARASFPTIIKGFEIDLDNDVHWDTGWTYSETSGGSGFIATTQAQRDALWGYEPCTFVDSQGITHYIIRHFWDFGLVRWRDGYFIDNNFVLTPQNFPDIEFKVTPTDEVRTFIIPIADDNITLRNHEYRFSVHATHPWWNESDFINSTVPGSGVLRSTSDVVPFMLQRVE